MATHTGHVMNLANSIIGVSLLAMPFCFKQCGITLAIVMLIISSIISKMACHFLVKSSTMCRRRNFEFLAFYTFGPSGKFLVEIGVIGFMMGTCVAFFVVMGDLGPAIISKVFNVANNGTLRTSVLIGLSLLVVLPLGLLKSVESLAAVSTVTIGFYFLFTLKIFFESSPRLFNGDWWYHVNFWQPEGILQCIPIFAMALSCQTQLFEIYDSLHVPTIDKMNSIVHSAINICTVVYGSVGLLGYIAYCKGNFSGNILLSFTPSFSSEIFKLGFVMSIAVSFPLVIFPCRASLFSLIFKRMPIHHELSQTSSHIPDSRFKGLTIGIVSVALVTGLLIPSIELVLGFVGSTIGVAICVIFPSLSFLNLSNKNTNERLMAKITLFTGVVIMIMGTFGNLFAAVENKPLDTSPVKFSNFKILPQSKAPSAAVSSTETFKNHKKGKLVPGAFIPEKSGAMEIPSAVKAKVDLSNDRRKEPLFPVVPVLQSKEILPSQIKIIEIKSGGNKVNFSQQSETLPKPSNNVKDSFNEIINKDAIEKEEREILETEKEKKKGEEEKQQELLKKLRQHQDEQKKLLREQEKILIEIKHRENEKKSMENEKEKSSLGIENPSKGKKMPPASELGQNKKDNAKFELKDNNRKEKEKPNYSNLLSMKNSNDNEKDSKGQKQETVKSEMESLGPEISIHKSSFKKVPLQSSPATKHNTSDIIKIVPEKALSKSKQEILDRDKRDLEKFSKENLEAPPEDCQSTEKKERKFTGEDRSERAPWAPHGDDRETLWAKDPRPEDRGAVSNLPTVEAPRGPGQS